MAFRVPLMIFLCLVVLILHQQTGAEETTTQKKKRDIKDYEQHIDTSKLTKEEMLDLLADITKKKEEAKKELDEGFKMVEDLFAEFEKKSKGKKERKKEDDDEEEDGHVESVEDHEKAKYSREANQPEKTTENEN